MKRIIFNIFTLCFFLSTSCMQQPMQHYNNLIMLFDQHMLETPDTSQLSITTQLISALEEQAAPIVVSPSLWHAFLERRARYKAQPTPFYKQFNALHQQATAIARKYITPEKAGKAWIHPPRDLYTAWNKIPIPDAQLKYPHPTRDTIELDYSCAMTRFDSTHWHVFLLPDFAYVLIPKAYELAALDNFKNKSTRLILKDKTQESIFGVTMRELALGLKVDHMQAIPNPEDIKKALTPTPKELPILQAQLQKLFVTRFDLGLLSTGDKTRFEAFRNQLLAQYQANALKAGNPLPTSRAELLDTFEQYLEPWNIFLAGHGDPLKDGGLIAGFAIADFKKLLSFLNNSIATQFLFYVSCFTGGKHLHDPYMFNAIPETFNFVIATGGSVDAPSTTLGLIVPLPGSPQARTRIAEATHINPVSGAIDLSFAYNQKFTRFFSDLNRYFIQNRESWYIPLAQILNQVHQYQDKMDVNLQNIPSIRFSNMPWFQADEIDKLTTSITLNDVLHAVRHARSIQVQQPVVLLKTNYIPAPIIIDTKGILSFISLHPGDAQYFFDTIHSSLDIYSFAYSFAPIAKQFYTKQFFIKKLSTKAWLAPDNKPSWWPHPEHISVLHNVVCINGDRSLFAQNFDEPVNILFFRYTDATNIDHYCLATWPTQENIKKISVLENTETIKKLMALFAQYSQTPDEFKDALKRQEHVAQFSATKAVPLFQKFKAKQHETQPALEAWKKTLSDQDRKLIEVLERSEHVPATPTITKKEFDAWRNAL